MKILKCDYCSVYTLKEICPYCNKRTVNHKPPKFSLEDKWGKYRRMAKNV